MMENFLRFQYLKLAPNCFKLEGSRKLSCGNRRLSSSDFTRQEHFPEIDKLRAKCLKQNLVEKFYKEFICNELIEECGIDSTAFYLHGFERMYIIKMDFSKLKKHNLIKPSCNQKTVFNRMLSYLEPFPFESELVEKSEEVTLKFMRDSIEKQYLAWKYKVNCSRISDIMTRLHLSFFTGRSLRNLRRNSQILDMIPDFKNENLSKKIYLINQLPFSVTLVSDFKRVFHYLNWDSFSSEWTQKGFCYSFSHIYFLIQILQSKGFRNIQIREGAPFLNLSFRTFIHRMNVMLSHPALSPYHKHFQFLHFLRYPTINFMNLETTNVKSIEDLKNSLDMIYSKMKLRKSIKSISISTIKYYTSSYFVLHEKHLKIIKRHPNFSVIKESQLGITLRYLSKKRFTEAEILESIIIILYPSVIINRALIKIEEEAEALKKVGFINGCVPEETNIFKTGTQLKCKTLQLCLYYIERHFNFSWDGVYDLWSKKSEEDKKL